MELKFVLARREEVNDYLKLKVKVWNETYRGIYPDEVIDNFDYEKQGNNFIIDIENNKRNMYFVCVDNEKVGYFSFGEPKYKVINYDVCINSLYLIKKCTRMGIGTKIFEFVKDNLKNKGFDRFFNGCNAHNTDAQKFYSKMGGKILKKEIGNNNKQQDQIYFGYEI